MKQLAKFVGVCGIIATTAYGCTASSERASDLELATAAKTSEVGLTVVDHLPPPPNTNDGKVVPIAVDDVIEISVYQVDQLNRTQQVANDGTVKLPLLGDVEVAGKSAETVEKELESSYGAKYLEAPDITVTIKDSAGQKIVMDGEFAKTGSMPIGSGTTLMRAIASAGGLSEIGDESKIWVFREIKNEKMVANYSIAEIRKGQKKDPRLYGGDVVVSFPSDAKVATRNLLDALGIARGVTSAATLL
jgi:polysaccharide biosynthesis/export protein